MDPIHSMCAIFRKIPASPSAPALALEHAETCEECQKFLETLSDEDAEQWLSTFDTLFLSETRSERSAEDHQWIASANQQLEDDKQRVIRCVQSNLLPRLSVELKKIVELWHPIAVFMAIDAVSMALARTFSRPTRANMPEVNLSTDGAAMVKRVCLPSEALQREIDTFVRSIGHHASSHGASADGLLWVVSAAREVTDLFLDFDSIPDSKGGVTLTPLQKSRRYAPCEEMWSVKKT